MTKKSTTQKSPDVILKALMSKPYVVEADYDYKTNIYTIKLADNSVFKSSDTEAWYGPGSMSRVKSPWLRLQQSETTTANNAVPLSSCTFIKPPEDIIGHPNHYCEGRKFEPKDVIRDWDLNFNLGNAVKYISRNGRKDGNSALQDLKKARQYLDFEIEYLEKEE